MKKFREWLFEYSEDDLIGDLAEDVKRKPPAGDWTANDLRNHLRAFGVGAWVMDAFKEACDTYAAHVAKITQTD